MNPSQFVKEQFKIVRKARSHHDKESAHRIRVAIKRLRALLRMIKRNEPAGYQTLNTRLKRAHKRLGFQRDKQIYFAWLEKHPKFNIQSMPFPIPHKDINLSSHQVESLQHKVISAIEGLERSPNKVEKSLQRSVRKFKRAKEIAMKSGSDGDFHEWRKNAKDLLYQLEATAKRQSLAKNLTKLGKILGDLHDLTVVREFSAGQEQPRRKKLTKKVDLEIKQAKKQVLKFARHLSPTDFRQVLVKENRG